MSLLPRSSRPEVRNPVLALPAAERLAALPEPARDALAAVLTDLARDAGERARAAWRGHKAPMALYWKIVAVYARHLARALRQAGRPTAAGRAPGRLTGVLSEYRVDPVAQRYTAPRDQGPRSQE